MNQQDFFHECEVKYRFQDAGEREAYEQRVRRLGFGFEGKQLETDFLPDTEDFQCRQHGLLLRFRRILSEAGNDILLTLKVKGKATAFQENFELEYRFSEVSGPAFEHINRILQEATGRVLQETIHDFDADHFEQLVAKVKAVFPAHRILLEKKRAVYTRDDCHILFDTLPEGIGDYLEIEAPSEKKLSKVIEELGADAASVEPLDYGDILKRHKHGFPDQEARTGLFGAGEREL